MPARDRSIDLFKELYTKTFQYFKSPDGIDPDALFPYVIFEIKNVFKSYATGVHIAPMLKFICTTLMKRAHIIRAGVDLSTPHANVQDFNEHKNKTIRSIITTKRHVKKMAAERTLDNEQLAIINKY